MEAGSGRIIVLRSNFEVLIFVEGLEPSHEETLRARTRANKLNPHVMVSLGQGQGINALENIHRSP